MAVFDLKQVTEKILDELTNKFKESADADGTKAQQMSDTTGRLMFKDSNGKTVYETVNE